MHFFRPVLIIWMGTFVLFALIGGFGIGLPSEWGAVGWDSFPWDSTGEAAWKGLNRHGQATICGILAVFVGSSGYALLAEKSGWKRYMTGLAVLACFAATAFGGYTLGIWARA